MTTTTTAADITAAARAAFHAAIAAGLDPAAALDNAGETVAELATRPGFFDQESLTWTYDEAPLTVADIKAGGIDLVRDRWADIPDGVAELSAALGVLEESDKDEKLYARLSARHIGALCRLPRKGRW